MRGKKKECSECKTAFSLTLLARQDSRSAFTTISRIPSNQIRLDALLVAEPHDSNSFLMHALQIALTIQFPSNALQVALLACVENPRKKMVCKISSNLYQYYCVFHPNFSSLSNVFASIYLLS